MYRILSGGGSIYAISELFNVYDVIDTATPVHRPRGVPVISVHEGTIVFEYMDTTPPETATNVPFPYATLDH